MLHAGLLRQHLFSHPSASPCILAPFCAPVCTLAPFCAPVWQLGVSTKQPCLQSASSYKPVIGLPPCCHQTGAHSPDLAGSQKKHAGAPAAAVTSRCQLSLHLLARPAGQGHPEALLPRPHGCLCITARLCIPRGAPAVCHQPTATPQPPSCSRYH